MKKKRLPKTALNHCTLPDWDETPQNAVYYHGFWLFPDEIERLKEIEDFHKKFGNECYFKPSKNHAKKKIQ